MKKLALILLCLCLMPWYSASAQTGQFDIGYGQNVSSYLSSYSPNDYWTFTGQAGDNVSVFMNQTNGTLDPFVSLLNNNATVIASNNNHKGSDAAILNYRLPYTGQYRIKASRAANGYGSYTLSLTVAQQNQNPNLSGQGGGRLQYGQFVRSAITTQDQAERWTFYGTQGDTVSIVMGVEGNTTGNLDPFLYLYGPNNGLLAYDDDSRGQLNAEIIYTLPTTGLYIVQATNYTQGTGAYWLYVANTTPTPPPVVTPPTGTRRLGEFRVEWYCNQQGYGVRLINNQTDWACTDTNTGNVVSVLDQEDFNAICRDFYSSPNAFAVKDQNRQIEAYNWSCYDYGQGVVTTPTPPPVIVQPTPTPPGGQVGVLTPEQYVEVNVRAGPSTSYESYGIIDWRETYPLLGETADGNWYIIRYQGERGYVSSRWAIADYY
jgi:hypothetical protein